MSVVWKFPLAVTDEQIVPMPAGAELLHVAEDIHGEIQLWARVIPGETAARRILIRGTGHPIWQQPYIGTVVARNNLVWHIFDGGEETT